MPPTLELEREFFKAAKDLKYYEDVRRKFLKKVKELAEDFIDYKIRCTVSGLEHKKTSSQQHP